MTVRSSFWLVGAGVGILLFATFALAVPNETSALMLTPMIPPGPAVFLAPGDRVVLGTLESETRLEDPLRGKRVLINACGGTTTPVYWIEKLRDRDPDTRIRAAQALGEMRDRTAVGALIRGLKDGDRNVRLAVVRALARMGPRANAAGPALRQMRTEDDAHLHEEVGRALEKIGATSQK